MLNGLEGGGVFEESDILVRPFCFPGLLHTATDQKLVRKVVLCYVKQRRDKIGKDKRAQRSLTSWLPVCVGTTWTSVRIFASAVTGGAGRGLSGCAAAIVLDTCNGMPLTIGLSFSTSLLTYHITSH